MFWNRSAPARWIVLLASLGLVCRISRAANFTVTTTSDSGAGSLRQAILDANANPGPDTIAFAIPGAGVQTISVATSLTITEKVTIDGYTQPRSSPNTDPTGDNAVLQVELAGSGTDGFVITAGDPAIQGLALYGFQNAVNFTGTANGLVAGCFVGLNAAGLATGGNAVGIWGHGAGLEQIGNENPANRNVISGNGVGIQDDAGGVVRGNLIGTNPAGNAAIANGTGVVATSTVQTQIGGLGSGQRNVISGNTGDGAHITGGSPTVEGNYIGLDATGLQRLGNGGVGLFIDSPGSDLIGGNYVSGNASDGIHLIGSLSSRVFANYIGLNVALEDVGNGGAGLHTSGLADGMLIAPFAPWLGNAIAHNREGLWIENFQFPYSYQASGNAIWENGGRGIVAGAVPEVQPNGGAGLNFPLITGVIPHASTTTIQGVYDGPSNTASVTFDVYSSPTCSKKWPWQFEEGRTWIGSIGSATVANGHVTFSGDVPVVITDEIVTATATFLVCLPSCFSAPNGGFVQWAQIGPFSQRLPWTIAPASGSSAGGDAVVVTGTDFLDGASVTIGGVPAGNVTRVSAYEIDATTPALAPGAAADVAVVNPDGTRGTLPIGFLSDFLDVPPAHMFHAYVRTLVTNGVASGVGGGSFGVDASTLRQQMAVFLLKAKHGICYAPPGCTGAFADVSCPSLFADWIEALAAEGITGGCGGGNYCPVSPVRRDQMAAFLLKAEHGSTYVPPTCAGIFADVACPSLFADWIEQLAAEAVTGGCGGGNYCPSNLNTRGQMAVFLQKTFSLQ
jgi:hypothetical protein